MKILQLITLVLIITILAACNKTTELVPISEVDETDEGYVFDCTFVEDTATAEGWFNEFEATTIEECNANQLTSKEDIEQNLIGEWELVGQASGWAIPVNMPCAHIKIEKEELVFTFKNAQIDTVTKHTWKIEEDTRFNEKVYQLTVEPLTYGLEIHSFCSNFMYYDYIPLDGDMVLYEKKK